ncbi:hypothetical protein VI817_010279 [Penicillium citrinum]|nr:hypothetical protein VI817_010279 [Penicillium citrinum]
MVSILAGGGVPAFDGVFEPGRSGVAVEEADGVIFMRFPSGFCGVCDAEADALGNSGFGWVVRNGE